MIAYTLDSDNELADLLKELKAFDKTVFRRIAREVIPVFERDLDRIFSYEPPRPDYPIRWKSEKQRRFVMAKLRREGNLPYRRTHELVRSWTLDTKLSEGVLTLEVGNTAPHAEFVYGPYQQPFLNKWPNAQDTILDAFVRLEDGIEAVIDTAIERL